MAPALGAWLGCSQQGRVRGSQVTFIVAAAADHGALFCAFSVPCRDAISATCVILHPNPEVAKLSPLLLWKRLRLREASGLL